MGELRISPLNKVYWQYGAKTIDFAGWDLPVQFSSIQEEHRAVRERAGLFDVSHMGEIVITGTRAEAFLQYLVTNDVSKLGIGDVQYAAMCDVTGGTIDDLIIYKQAFDRFLLVVNAANTDKDFEWITSHAFETVTVRNASMDMAQLALQGPRAEHIMQKMTSEDVSAIKPFTFRERVDMGGVESLVSRTGYTGEDGFEIYCSWQEVEGLWQSLLEAGKGEGLLPCGLGARDTLRFEARLALYGQELTESISPIEGGIAFAVKMDKDVEFIGKAALKKQKEEGSRRHLVGLEMIDKGIPRIHYGVYADESKIGEITTGMRSLTLKKNLGLALMDHEFAELGSEVEIDIRGKRRKAKIVKTPFYKRA